MAIGKLAKAWCGKALQLQVLHSAAGFYIGTFDEEGPCSRESLEYWPTERAAHLALENGQWTQRSEP